MCTLPMFTDEHRALQAQRKAYFAGRLADHQILSERDLLWAFLEAVVSDGPVTPEFCQDYAIDCSLELPSKLALLKHVHQRITEARDKHSTRNPLLLQNPESLPASDIPLEVIDP